MAQSRIPRLQLKGSRLGLLMIAATLAVIGLTVLAVDTYLTRSHERLVRSQGVGLSRSLSSLPLDQLRPPEGQRSVLHTAVGAQRSDGFAYALLVTPDGRPLVEVSAPGTFVPRTTPPKEPTTWFGEQRLRLPDTGQDVIEFHSPVVEQGTLAGFIRLGYFAAPVRSSVEQLTFPALLALPIFLLAPLFYGLMLREIRPLRRLAHKLQRYEPRSPDASQPTPPTSPSPDQINDLVDRFGRFLSLTEARMARLKAEQLDTVASSRLLTYRMDKAEAVLQALPEGVLVLDETGRPNFANACVESLIGALPADILGQPPSRWCKEPELLKLLSGLRVQAGEPVRRTQRIEVAISKPTPRHLAVGIHPLLTPRDTRTSFGTLVVLRDVSQERLARQAGSEFASHVSHELKTPLASIQAYSELLMDQTSGTDEATRIESVNVIHDEAGRMAALINNLLNISKIESGSMNLKRQRVNLRDLLVDAFEAQRQAAVDRSLDFRLDVPPNLGAAAVDKDLFRIAVNNLLSNAIKYNRPGGLVALSAEEGDDQMLEIRVRDTGIGIAASQKDRIFDKFYRLGDTESETGSGERRGHGLGLYLVKQIVELHHGSIAVDSQPGRGTEFCVRVRKLTAVYEESVAESV